METNSFKGIMYVFFLNHEIIIIIIITTFVDSVAAHYQSHQKYQFEYQTDVN